MTDSSSPTGPARERFTSLHQCNAPFEGWHFVAWVYVLGVFSSSFDIFGVIRVGPTLRVAQVFFLLPIVAAWRLAALKRVAVPLGFWSLAAWCGFILAFIPHTTYLPRNIGYGAWLLFSVALVLATVQLFTDVGQIIWLTRWYLYSFLFAALFGVVQFVAPLVGLGAPLIVQWWFPGLLPRVNGFSYEPSYFATYLLIGWVLTGVLLQSKSRPLSRARLLLIFAFCTVALILTSSRSGWIMMALWFMQYPVRLVGRLIRGRVRVTWLLQCAVLGGLALVTWLVLARLGFDRVYFLLAGTGLEGTVGWSVAPRLGALHDTLRVFAESPIIGYSLGGVAAAIASLHGTAVSSFQDAKLFEGNSVLAETLAASGIIGFMPFVTYIVTLTRRPVQLASGVRDPLLRGLLLGNVVALLFELVMLQFNQNVLRLYLWVHIAILCATYNVVRREVMIARDEELGACPPATP